MNQPVPFLIVGSGYRAEYYGRIARRYPDLFSAMFLCRSPEKASLMRARTGTDATCDADEAGAFSPAFAVVAVDRGHMADVIETWAERGVPVLAETPVGASPEQLDRVWALASQRGARITSAEQYHRYPVMMHGFRAVEAGLIGTPVSAYVSLAHDYHGFSLITRMLGTVGEAYSLRAVRQETPVLVTDSRYGAIMDGSETDEARDTVFITFESGKTAVYDFSPAQYRSFIRSRHVVVRGTRGEWSDRLVCYADEHGLPARLPLMPDIPEAYRALDTQALRDVRKTWTQELFLDTAQDEFAIASMLLDMTRYVQGGPTPYPLPDALDDARFWLLVQDAVRQPFVECRAPCMPWRDA